MSIASGITALVAALIPVINERNAPGASDYQTWLAQGNTGTLADYRTAMLGGDFDWAAQYQAALGPVPGGTSGAASEALIGVTQFATAAETVAGILEAKAVSPRRLRGDVAWTTLPFQPGWSQFGGGFAPAAYRKDGLGYVHIKGLVAYTSTAAITIATLPAGYLPKDTEIFTSASNGAVGSVTVSSNGTIQSQFRAAGASWMSLSGIVYLAEG